MAAIATGDFTGGNGQYLIKTSLSGAPNLQASSTICVRVKHNTTSTTLATVIADFCNNALSSAGACFGRNSGVASTGMNTYRAAGSSAAVYSTCYGNTTTWYHLTFVYNASTAFIRFFIDGVFIGQQASATTVAASSTANSLIIGWHPGKFADAAIWNRALTDLEVASQAAYRVCQVTSGLLGFWRLDANGNDTSGNSQTFTAGGTGTAVSYSTADNPPQPENPPLAIDGDAASSSALSGSLVTTKPVAGATASSSAFAGQAQALVKGNAASSSAFTGALRAAVSGAAASSSALAAWIRPRWGRRVEVNPTLNRTGNTLVASAPWTVMTWLRGVTISSPDFAFFNVQSTTAQPLLQLYLDQISGTTRVRASFDDSSGTNIVNYTSAAVGTAWHHATATNDGTGVIRIYLDGALVVTSPAATITGGVLFDRFRFSVNGAAVSEFAQAKAFASQLTAAQIVAELTYNQPHQAPAYAWWQLSWQSPTLDSSGNGRTLTDSGSTEAQSESPGVDLSLLAGAAASSSAFAGSLSTTKPITGALASTSSFAAAVTALLTGPAASSSALAGQLTALLSGSAASTSVLSGTLTARLAAAASSSSSLAGALQMLLAGAAASSSAFSGTLGLSGQFAGNATTSSAFNNPTLNVNAGVTGNLATSSALAGALQALMAGSAASTSVLSGKLSANIAGPGIATSSAFQGALTAQIVGNAASASLLAGVLKLAQALVGVLASASSFSGTLTTATQLQFAGNAATQSLLSGALSVTQIMAAIGGDTYTGGSVDQVFYSDANPGPLVPQRQWPPRPR